MHTRRARWLWRVLQADATGSGIAVGVALGAVPLLAVLGAPRSALVAVGVVVVAAAVVLGGLGVAMAAIVGQAGGDVELPADLAGLRWPGAARPSAGAADLSGAPGPTCRGRVRHDRVSRAVAPARVPRGPRP